MDIRIKLSPISKNTDGADSFGRVITNDCMKKIFSNKTCVKQNVFLVAQKIRKPGKVRSIVSSKEITVKTRWVYEIYEVPQEIISLLKMNGKKIVQGKKNNTYFMDIMDTKR